MLRRCKKSVLLFEQSGIELTPIFDWRLTSLRYSPTSACLKHTMPVGSSLLASAVDLATTPKPYTSISYFSLSNFRDRTIMD